MRTDEQVVAPEAAQFCRATRNRLLRFYSKKFFEIPRPSKLRAPFRRFRRAPCSPLSGWPPSVVSCVTQAERRTSAVRALSCSTAAWTGRCPHGQEQRDYLLLGASSWRHGVIAALPEFLSHALCFFALLPRSPEACAPLRFPRARFPRRRGVARVPPPPRLLLAQHRAQ